MFFAVGMLFMVAFWHEASREPVWIGAALSGLGVAILAAMRTVEIDPQERTVRVRRRWAFLSWEQELGFDAFTGIAIARTPSTTPSYCVMLLAQEAIKLPTQGRNRKGARRRAKRIASLMQLPMEDEAREVSSVPMV
jgi:hypothetical protein